MRRNSWKFRNSEKLILYSFVFAFTIVLPCPSLCSGQDSDPQSILQFNDPKIVETKSNKKRDLATTSSKAPIDSSTSKPPVASHQATDAGHHIDKLLTELVLENIPHQFEEDKDWGGQKERWDGIKFRREGFKIETKRKKKMVNHGSWKKYSVSLLNPQKEFSIQLKNMRELDNGKLGLDIHFTANLKIDGRQSKWVKGVQLYSFSLDGHAKVRLKVAIELEIGTDFVKLPPDMIFKPVATEADLIVDEFRIDRISKAGGEVAQQISKSVRKQFDKKIAEKETKLVEKINKQFDKKKDDLRLSVADAMKSKWADVAKPFLSETLKDEN